MAKVLLSKSEWKAIDDYINFIIANPDPCDGCQDSGRCCGCPKEKAYRKKIKEIDASKLMEIKDVQQYAELSVEYAKAQKKLEEAQEMVKKVSIELAEVKARFIEDANDIRARFKCPLCKCEYEAPISICEGYVTACGVGFKYHCPKCKAVRVTTDCYKKDK